MLGTKMKKIFDLKPNYEKFILDNNFKILFLKQ